MKQKKYYFSYLFKFFIYGHLCTNSCRKLENELSQIVSVTLITGAGELTVSPKHDGNTNLLD